MSLLRMGRCVLDLIQRIVGQSTARGGCSVVHGRVREGLLSLAIG
jgi:hypothetical protein